MAILIALAALVSQARAILAYSRPVGEAVRDGTIPAQRRDETGNPSKNGWAEAQPRPENRGNGRDRLLRGRFRRRAAAFHGPASLAPATRYILGGKHGNKANEPSPNRKGDD
jgi:hypothetical protein